MSRPTSPSPSRRTLVKGAAWAVPAVAVASAAPVYAQSPTPNECLDITPGGEACKDPGQTGNAFGFRLQYCFTNTCETGSITVTVTRVFGANGGYSLPLDPPEVLTIPAGGQRCTGIYAVNGTNSGNFQGVDYTVGGVAYSDNRLPAPPRDCLPEELGTQPALADEDAIAEQSSVEESVAGTEDVETTVETPASDVEKSTPADQPAATEAEVPAPEVKETPDVQAPDTSQQTATPSNS